MRHVSGVLSKLLSRRGAYLMAVRSTQLLLFAVAAIGAFLLRFEFQLPAAQKANMLVALATCLVTKPCLFHVFGLGRDSWRFVSLRDVVRILYAHVVAGVAGALVIRSIAGASFPRSFYLLDFMLSLLLTTGVRFVARVTAEGALEHIEPGFQRTLIYGAGAAGTMLAHEIRANPHLRASLRGFIDDDPVKAGMLIQGTPVLGTGDAVADLVRRHVISQVLIAIPSATGQQMTRILRLCAATRVTVRTMPPIAEIIEGRGLTTQIRNVAVEDLLGRTQVQLEEESIREKLEDRVVAVTGAAGSIGSELCRQIARFRPRTIVAIDFAETALFFLDAEMRTSFPAVRFEPVIGDIRNRTRMDEVFAAYPPETVYHAAAYKHVPMMESHVFEAIENNVLGTFNVAAAAARADVQQFVMISSDKAVRPTNIMGLTKRVAEILVSSLQDGRTRYMSVRFGNVLASNGSVVPIFRSQIASGGPVTVTHPDMQRYFMTIPEAVQLVLQASVMGKGGELFVLDMGQPVSVLDLARNMILLSGLRPDEDIKIVFTGIRPGEKLSEELSHLNEGSLPTYHEKIRIFSANGARIPNVAQWTGGIARMCLERNLAVVLALKDLVPDYNPSLQVLREMLNHAPEPAAAAAGVKADSHPRWLATTA